MARGQEMALNSFEILGVASTATPAEIKRSYRELSRITHPDHGGNPALFRLVTSAYRELQGVAPRDEFRERRAPYMAPRRRRAA